MLYGRFAMSRAGRAVARACMSTRSASACTTSRRPSKAAATSLNAGRQRWSRSIATTRPLVSARSARVRPPGPGPTSMMVAASAAPPSRAMRPVKFRSRMKFWPRLLRADKPCARITSRNGGKRSGAAVTSSTRAHTPGQVAGMRAEIRGWLRALPDKQPVVVSWNDGRLARMSARSSRSRG